MKSRPPEKPDPFKHRCPLCGAAFVSLFQERPTACPSCGGVILDCGVCGGKIRRPPVVYCERCNRLVCMNCRNSEDFKWRGMKWWTLCNDCGSADMAPL